MSVDKVLVIGDDTRSFLSTVRSLGRKGIEVHVAPFDFGAPALQSRYISKVHFLPYYLDGGEDWRREMLRMLQTERFSLIIPCDERALLPLCIHRDLLESHCALAVPSPAALEAFFDKAKTRELADATGVAVARGRMRRADDSADAIAAEFGLPVVLKEPRSYALPELYARTSTKIVNDRKALATWLERNPVERGPILIEQMFGGVGVGVSVLCDGGEVLQAFEHHRATELDGSSYYRKSAPLDPGRLAAVERMARAVKYTGLAMFEFKVNAANEWILIEVNARPWGSLPLPVSIGVDFPYFLYLLLVKGQRAPRVVYDSERYGRNLLLDFWQARVHSSRLQKGAALSHWGSWLGSFRRLLSGREHMDVAVLDDLRPAWVEGRDFVLERLKRGARKAPAVSLTGLAAGKEAAHVMFVCQGNINRSSYAELRARQVLADFSGRMRFSSAGMLPRNARPSPPLAIQTAHAHGVDMSAHRSRHATRELLESASLVVVFDHINLRSLAARYPGLSTPVVLLDEVAGVGAGAQIHDPEDGTPQFYETTFSRIDACIDHWRAQFLSTFGQGK